MIRNALRWLLGVAYAAAGVLHIAAPRPFVAIVPDWVPAPETVVLGTGAAELLGAIGLLQPWSHDLRRAAGRALALYALCVWPANFHHFALDLAKPGQGLGLAYHIPRLLAQPLIMWLALWTSEATDWPFARQGGLTKR